MSAWTWRTILLLWIAGIALILAAGKGAGALSEHWYAVADRAEAAMAKAKGVDISRRDGTIYGLAVSPSEARVLERPMRSAELAATLFACVALADLVTLVVLTVMWVRFKHVAAH